MNQLGKRKHTSDAYLKVNSQNHKLSAHLSVDILQHDVLGFKVSVYDLVFVQILDPRAWSRKHQILPHANTVRHTTDLKKGNAGRTDIVE